MNHTVLFRCDASSQVGFGHVMRCLALARVMRSRYAWDAAFAMVEGPAGRTLVKQHGFLVYMFGNTSQPCDEGRWVELLLAEADAAVLVVDVRSELSLAALQAIRAHGVLIATVDDPSERRLAADFAFYPPVPQVRRLDWSGFTGDLYIGWEWVVLRPEFAWHRQLVTQHRECKSPDMRVRILVTMGGSDPAGLTLKALKALDSLDNDFETMVILGPGFMHLKALATWLANARRSYHLRHSVRGMPTLMAEADLAVASFGVTAYELAAMGVPSVYLCLTEDHAESASVFVDAGIALSLGFHTDVSEGQIARSIRQLLDDRLSRQDLGTRARVQVDGKGAQRVAGVIASILESIGGRNGVVLGQD